uniref:Viral protein E1^E4 n=1 Tax=Mus musculus papillomavirus type 1 TaxID=763552 RepID=A0A2D3I4N5_9PAPI|nr:viral protein E1^E4 [Mus musculus papillomavirus type 1]
MENDKAPPQPKKGIKKQPDGPKTTPPRRELFPPTPLTQPPPPETPFGDEAEEYDSDKENDKPASGKLGQALQRLQQDLRDLQDLVNQTTAGITILIGQ